jgi:pimeloyl-ACP methyl ester carboxylesterase
MNTATKGTWIGIGGSGPVVVRFGGSEGSTVDRPALGRFREPYQGSGSPGGGALVDGALVDGALVDGALVDGAPLRPVVALPAGLNLACGWYDGPDGRQVLLTQIPEEFFGEPIALLAEGDEVVRTYPVDATTFVGEDGVVTELVPGGLRRTAAGDTTMLARSTRYRETEVGFTAGARRLAGTVIQPDGLGLGGTVTGPAAVVVHPAAGGQRDFCRLFAAPLLAAGLTVLIFDKPGYGHSESDGEETIFSRADAASAGVDLLASFDGVDPRRVGLLGFSNGMWSAPMLAARRTDIAFLAGFGAPGVSQADAEIHRRTKVLRDVGVGEATVGAVGEAWRCIFDIAGSGVDRATPELTGRLERAISHLADAPDLAAYEIPGYAIQNPTMSAVPPLVPVAQLLEMLPGDPDPEVLYDPALDYARLRCPVFLQYGSEDVSVPVDASVSRIRAARAGRQEDLTIHVYPGVEHMLNVLPADVTGLTAEAANYGYHHFRFATGVWDDLTSWLRNVPAAPGGSTTVS